MIVPTSIAPSTTTAKTIVVIGGTSGIGLEIAKDVVARGDKVVLSGRDLARAQEVAASIGENATGVAVDLSEPHTIRDGLKDVGTVNGLVLVAIERDANTVRDYDIDRATRLVEQLLTLSRLEAGAAPQLGQLDLAALVRSVLAEQAIHALHKQQTLELDVPTEACSVAGDATLLAVLVRNLIDNAVRYSPREATIKVAVTRSTSAVQLSVQDSGPGIAEADRARIGERFFRVLGSGQGGSGLGWSIVKRIATVHGAEVRLDKSAALGGLDVMVSWSAT